MSGKAASEEQGVDQPELQPDAAQRQPDPLIPVRVDRSAVIGDGLKAAAAWSLRIIIIGVALFLAFWLLGQVWVGVRPIVLALILSTVLYPPVAWLTRHHWPPALAAAAVLVTALVMTTMLLAVSVQLLLDQSGELADSTVSGVQQVRDWLTGPPVNLADERIDTLTAQVIDRLRDNAAQIATGLVNGVSAVTSGVITAVLVLVLTFFFVKDGRAFLPWLRREVGINVGGHLTEVFARSWKTLGDFIRVQAIVSFVDAFFIGLGLIILGVPLAVALAVLTFVAGFIPIVGALAAGAVAVLVALVSNGPTTALIVLIIIIIVQQVESNVLQPVLQGRSLNLHAAIVVLSVTAGGALFGITGAFLAVPLVAVAAAVLRYLSEQISLRTGEVQADELAIATPEGSAAARRGERVARRLRERLRRGRPDD